MIRFTVLPAKAPAGDCAAACPTAITPAKSTAGSAKAIVCLLTHRNRIAIAARLDTPRQIAGLTVLG
jgi:hypothetical protein